MKKFFSINYRLLVSSLAEKISSLHLSDISARRETLILIAAQRLPTFTWSYTRRLVPSRSQKDNREKGIIMKIKWDQIISSRIIHSVFTRIHPSMHQMPCWAYARSHLRGGVVRVAELLTDVVGLSVFFPFPIPFVYASLSPSQSHSSAVMESRCII